jgi:hypothetical protein
MTRMRRWTLALVVSGLMGAANAWTGNAQATSRAAKQAVTASRSSAEPQIFRPDAGPDSLR